MNINHYIKPLLLGLIMLFSMLFLGFGLGASIMFSIIPIALGSLNVMTRVAYSLTALALIAAALSTVIKKDDLDGLKTYIRGFIDTVDKDKAQKEKAQ